MPETDGIEKAMNQMLTMIETKVRLERARIKALQEPIINVLTQHLMGEPQIDRASVVAGLQQLTVMLGDE